MHERAGVPLLEFETLATVPGLRHFLSTRLGGISDPPYDSLNLALHVADDAERVLVNRRRLSAALGVDLRQFVMSRQVHGNRVAVVGRSDRGAGVLDRHPAMADTDALITQAPGVMLTLLQADCAPILLYDPVRGAIGLAHAGWGGTVLRVTEHTLHAMSHRFGCHAENVIAAIGPSIGPCCYEVGPDVVGKVQTLLAEPATLLRPHPEPGKAYFDLWRANRDQLIAGGVREERIELCACCTRCQSKTFFSDRGRRPTGRFGAGMMLLES